MNWSGFSDTGSGIAGYRLLAGITIITLLPALLGGRFIYIGPNTSYLHTLVGNTVYYRLCAEDGAENSSTGITATATPEIDTTPPTGSVVINGDATYTSKLLCHAHHLSFGPKRRDQMCVSEAHPPVLTTSGGHMRPLKNWYTSTSGGQTI